MKAAKKKWVSPFASSLVFNPTLIKLAYKPYVTDRWETKVQIKTNFQQVLPVGSINSTTS